MRIETFVFQFVLGVVLSVVLSSGTAHAVEANEKWRRDQARQLDKRFAELAAARTKAEANQLESQIWALWYQSGCDDVDSLLWQTQLALGQGQHNHAVGLADRLVRMAPRHAEAWNMRATVRFFMGDHAGSTADIARTLRLEPRHFGALAGMTSINMQAKNWRAALKALRKALEIHPFLQDRSLLKELEARVRAEAR